MSDQHTFTLCPGSYLPPTGKYEQIIFDDPDAAADISHLCSGRVYPKLALLVIKRCREIIWPRTAEEAKLIQNHCAMLHARHTDAERVRVVVTLGIPSFSCVIQVPMVPHGIAILETPRARFSGVLLEREDGTEKEQLANYHSSRWASAIERGGALPFLRLVCQTDEEYASQLPVRRYPLSFYHPQ